MAVIGAPIGFPIGGVEGGTITNGPVTTGVFTLTGFGVTFQPVESLQVGSFALTGKAVTFQVQEPLTVGTFVLTGNGAVGKVIQTAATGTFVLSGFDVAPSLLAQSGGGKRDKAPKRRLFRPVWDRPRVVTPGATVERPRPVTYPPASLFKPPEPRLQTSDLPRFEAPPAIPEVAAGIFRAREMTKATHAMDALEAISALRAAGVINQ